jgi:integrase
MNQDLWVQIECYVGLRTALGYVVRSEEKLLKDFAQFLDSRGIVGPIRAQLALDWACTPAAGRGPAGQASRLKVVRRFLAYLRAVIPETEVPGPNLTPPLRRPQPHIYSPEELEKLMEAAERLPPKGSLRPHTYTTLIGLLASTGLRVGEAIRLKVGDVHLQAEPPHLQIVQTKFRKSRLVVLHPTAEKMQLYAERRRRLHYDALSDAFFVSERGDHFRYQTLRATFNQLARATGLRKGSKGRGPSIHGLRHTFAVERMRSWQQNGQNVRDLLPHLSVYLGHVQPMHTYWYLTATLELLSVAADAFQLFAAQGGNQ